MSVINSVPVFYSSSSETNQNVDSRKVVNSKKDSTDSKKATPLFNDYFSTPDFGNILKNNDIWDDFLDSILYGDINLSLGQPFLGSGSKIFSKVNNSATDFQSLKSKYNAQDGANLASIAAKRADGTVGSCLKYVRKDLEEYGFSSGSLGDAACKSADSLSANKHFAQVNVTKSDLSNLPAGCIIIFDRGNNTKRLSGSYGHIMITDGNGNGFSDHKEVLSETVNNYSNSYVVLVPKKTKGTLDSKS